MSKNMNLDGMKAFAQAQGVTTDIKIDDPTHKK
jgi:hypothetical protein